ncbi:MAG: RNA-binding protein [Candidatus Thorarchaeota archaeon]|nr:RNA-binding protein [Candidatus Thorarchaeota archaeon]
MAVYFQKREIVVPGQLLAEGRYRPSEGTYSEKGKIYASVVGLAELRGNRVKVVALEGVYIPREGDLVLGTITIVAGNNWKVDIGGPYGASLHANNALRRPYSDDISEYMDIGDVIAAEVMAFDRSGGPFLSMKGRGLRKLTDGMILHISPAKIPRIIGRRGSMINMVKDQLRIQTMVGQNGRIWIRAPNTEILRLAIKAFKMIEAEAHTSKLTDRVKTMLEEEMAKLEGLPDETEAEMGSEDTPDITDEPEPQRENDTDSAPEVPDVEETPSTKKAGNEVAAKEDEAASTPDEEAMSADGEAESGEPEDDSIKDNDSEEVNE